MAIILDWGKRKNFTLDPKVMPYQNHSKSRVGRLSQIHIIQTNRYFTVFSYGSVWKYCIPIIPMDYQHFPSQNGYLGFWPRHILTPMVTTGDPPWLSTQWLKDYWWNRHIIYHNRYVCYVLCKYCTLLSHTYIYWHTTINNQNTHHFHLLSEALLVGGFNPSEKYERQLGLLLPIYGKITNVPNHQPVKYISHIIFNQVLEFTTTNTITSYKPW